MSSQVRFVFVGLVVAFGALACGTSQPAAEPSAAPTVSAPVAAEAPAAAKSCTSSADCAQGEACTGDAGCNTTWTCQPSRPCTRDLREYCGCDGKTFQSSGSCPAKKYSKKEAC